MNTLIEASSVVRQEVLSSLPAHGLSEDTADTIVIDSELEDWIWQGSPHVQIIVSHRGEGLLRDSRKFETEWPEGQCKPLKPKASVREFCKLNRTSFGASLYCGTLEELFVKQCEGPAFQLLSETFRRWFPIGGAV